MLDEKGGVRRYTRGELTTIAAPGERTWVTRGEMTSPTDGWALSETGVRHFDGAVWSEAADLPAAIDLVAVAADDVWTVGAAGIGHYDGVAWTIRPRSGLPLTRLARLGQSDVWAFANDTRALHRVGDAWQVVDFDDPAGENDRVQALLGTPTGVWVMGTHVVDAGRLPWLYAWDGETTRPHPAPTRVADLREVDGVLFALGTWDGAVRVSERTGGRWVVRDDLDPEVVFPSGGPLPFPGPVCSVADGRRWLVGGSWILRHDP
jgi:hypothetical protein